jgi:Transposase
MIKVNLTVPAQLRRTGHADQATTIKHTRWALLKNPPELTGDQRTTIAAIAKDNGPLYRAYLLKDLDAPSRDARGWVKVDATPVTPATSASLASIYVSEQLRMIFQACGARI